MKIIRIARRELSAYFSQPIAYVVVGALLVLCGIYTFIMTPFFVIGEASLKPFFEFCPFVLTLVIPAITMGLIAEDRRNGMLELLQSWPVGDIEFVTGKFMGAWALICFAWVLSFIFPMTVATLGPIDWGPVIGGYIGLTILSAAYLGLGLLASCLSRSQIVAYIISFALCFGFFVIGKAAAALPLAIGQWVDYLSFDNRFSAIAAGVVELRDLIYFFLVTAVSIGLSAEFLHSRRWRK